MALSGVDVYAHNLETVERLQKWVRDRRASYNQSLSVLRHAKEKNANLITKSSLMLGLGESEEEIKQTFKDLQNVGVSCITLGQYLQVFSSYLFINKVLKPTFKHMKVHRYVPPEEFDYWKQYGEDLGFLYVASGPLVRSSYKAGVFYIKNILNKKSES